MYQSDDTPEPQEEQPVSEKQKMIGFSIIVMASTLLGIILLISLSPQAWMFSFFIPTAIWFVMIFFFFFEKLLDRLKAYLDESKNQQK